MISILKKEECCGCGACVNACHNNVIKMLEDKEGFLYPVIDGDKCVDCGLCKKVCPVINKQNNIEYETCYLAVKNKDEAVRRQSSSGGVFTAIASKIIEKNGVVFGVGFNDKLTVEHFAVEQVESLNKLRGSKYLQSNTKDSYKKIKELLKNGNQVLFSGTPCQVAGLKSFLGKDFDNLYTQGVVCHGAPSAKIFRKYLDEIEQKQESKITKVNFRNKENGWKKYYVTFEFENGKVLSMPFFENPYMKAFLKNLSLRPSCYDCNFKGDKLSADITLADYWGIEEVLPEFDDDKGTSLVIIHSEKGKKLFDSVCDCFEVVLTSESQAVNGNPSIVKSSYKNPNRNKFFKKVYDKPLDKTVDKCSKSSIIRRIKNKFKAILRKIK